MSDVKKQAILFKKRAKELGYDIKLTHCQEILATLNGHQTRHSYLLANPEVKEVLSSANKLDQEANIYIDAESFAAMNMPNRFTFFMERISRIDNPEMLLELMHKDLGHQVIALDHKLDPYGVCLIVEWPKKGRVAVIYRGVGKKITGKHIHKLRKSMETMGCARGILYTSSEDVPQTLHKHANDNDIEIVDYEDMLRLAYQMDNKATAVKDLTPGR